MSNKKYLSNLKNPVFLVYCIIVQTTIQTQLYKLHYKQSRLYKLHNNLDYSLYILHIPIQSRLQYTLTIVNDTYLLSRVLCPLWAFLAHLAHSMRTRCPSWAHTITTYQPIINKTITAKGSEIIRLYPLGALAKTKCIHHIQPMSLWYRRSAKNTQQQKHQQPKQRLLFIIY